MFRQLSIVLSGLPRRVGTIALAAFVVFAIEACRPATDLNQRCALVKRNPDGGKPLPIPERDVRNAQGANKDFIAIGSLDCEDLICVRDSAFSSDSGLDDPAEGYCSRQCQQGTSCPSYDENLDRGQKALNCRALLLSAETLAALTGDGGFAGVRDPYFCARGGAPDAGN